jgi:hypothetical protein
MSAASPKADIGRACWDVRLAPLSDIGLRSRLLRQIVEQRLRLLQIARVEAFGEPAIDRREKIASLLRLFLIALETCEPHGSAEFPGFCLLLTRHCKCALKIFLGLCCIPLWELRLDFTSNAVNLCPRTTFPHSSRSCSSLRQWSDVRPRNSPAPSCVLARMDKSNGARKFDPVERKAFCVEIIMGSAFAGSPVRARCLASIEREPPSSKRSFPFSLLRQQPHADLRLLPRNARKACALAQQRRALVSKLGSDRWCVRF